MVFTIVNMISFRREDGLMWNNQFLIEECPLPQFQIDSFLIY